MNPMQKVHNFLNELNVTVDSVDQENTLFTVNDEEKGYRNLFIDVDSPLLVVQQVLGKLKDESTDSMKTLLKANTTLVHGAFCLLDDGTVMFRDTLALENLDRNELESTLNALSLAMVEHSTDLLKILK